jgi:hypothetical protein
MNFPRLMLLALVALATLGAGCATTPAPDDDERSRNTSSIPWNRPQGWEGGGGMGGFRPPGTGY